MIELRPIAFSEAAAFVDQNHRHHKRPTGHKFSIACYDGERLCGVAMVGRPVSRYLDDGLTLEMCIRDRCNIMARKNGNLEILARRVFFCRHMFLHVFDAGYYAL